MKGILRYVEVVGPERALEDFEPGDPEIFGYWLRLCVGHEANAGCDDFFLYVCSPRWLEANWPLVSRGEVMPGKGLLLLRSWNREAIVSWVRDLLDATEGRRWESVAERLNRHLNWERSS